ncbi:MAG: hypothetical protein HYV53_03660 [Parcubacteria group bacterium]|nr:hypothetical protein [Parcubacteria group bacterium]
MDSKKIIATFVIITAAVVGLYFSFLLLSSTKPKTVSQANKITESAETTVASTPQITQAKPASLSAGFPETIPLEGKTKIVESYSANYQNSAVKQFTVVFESKKTAKENYEFYKKWAEDNKWQIINFLDKDNLKALYLRKDNEDINAVINGKSVNISYVKF